MQDFRLDPQSLSRMLGEFRGPAPVQQWHPPYCGEIDMRIARDGRWYHNGQLIRRAALVQLFASVLRREPDGSFSLVTPAERVTIRVEDCPFVATLLNAGGEGEQGMLEFTLNTGERVQAGPQHRLLVTTVDGEPHPVLQVRDGLDALISRNVFYQLAALAQVEASSQGERLVLWSGGEKFVLGQI
ncbi:MAG: DUF1285 domain-containing protein [Pseudomonadales bacterium]|nr:DUF1285 domain-containing protein [Pseudomonadales bacterium]MCP5331637.1 DUF1285 domain-containing protein [Pseudomonadales bacterium]MCP5344732.1 DUF1285 domain-containing protein [Pseudomonadales bacterium]